ncbi:MAG: PP2C family serine/threonine-protein phosphatase [Candidatus Moraniibacteriota bacterium]
MKPNFQNILICKKKENRPFLEILIEEPENISRKNLGILVGIFQINDYSEDSSYIVNYLISVIKKEYFAKTNRGPVENFEAALHKANLALAGLATHENINWIGHINAVCAVIEKNNLLLSVTGTASAFLLRKNALVEITENPLEEMEISPLKTFQDVISGKIENGDKLFFTTQELFELFSLEEIKKSALKFSRENFIQFLNTALVNELDQVATLVVDVAEVEELEASSSTPAKTPAFNAFSQAAFRASKKPKPKDGRDTTVPNEDTPTHGRDTLQCVSTEPTEDTTAPANEEARADFVDKKTGHIYLKENPTPLEDPTSRFSLPAFDFSHAKEKLAFLAVAFGKTAQSTTQAFTRYLKETTPKFKTKKEKTSDELEALIRSNLQKEVGAEEVPSASKERRGSATSLRLIYQNYAPKIKAGSIWLWEKFVDLSILILRWPAKFFLRTSTFAKAYYAKKQKERNAQKSLITPKKAPAEENVETFFAKSRRGIFAGKKTEATSWTAQIGHLWPDFSKLKTLIGKFNAQQKISVVAILFLLLVVPYWISRWERQLTEKTPAPVVETPVVTLPLEEDKNVTRLADLTEIFVSTGLTKIQNLNGKLFALRGTAVVDMESQKEIAIPTDFQNPQMFFGMDDLNLIFLVKNNRVASLAPATGKFTPNNLTFPENSEIVSAETYLTYAYLFDGKNNQIYRYPRAEGGFGEKTAWLKDELVLADAKNMAINENVFLASENEIQKLFRGKKVEFSIEETATSIKFTKLYTKRDSANLYVLDKANARVVKLDNDGKILAQYYNAKIAEADDFSVNEENSLVYLLSADGVESFEMNR